MFRISLSKRLLCLLLSLLLVVQPLFLSADEDNPDQNAQTGAFDPAQAVSPGEYLARIKELRGADRQEMEKHSWAQWATIMTNVFILLDPKAIDVPSYQNTLGSVLGTKDQVRGILTGSPIWMKAFGKITTWGLVHFAKGDSGFAALSGNILKSWKWVGNRPAAQKLVEFAKFMKAPSGKGGAGSFQQWLRRKPPTEGAQGMSTLAGVATVVGTVLQILAGCAEIKSFFDAWSDDPGRISWGTVQHVVQGTLLIATAVMALIPPPGVWAVAAVVVMLIWGRIKDVFNRIGDKIQKWHKVYEDSNLFMKEMDHEFAAFLNENKTRSVFGVDQEKSSALKFADDMQRALEKSPGEGEIAERHRNLVQNMRQQGLLTTWYYQQATASRELPTEKKVLYEIWNHRADYMAWKPRKPKKWYDVGGWVNAGIDLIGQEITNSDGKMEADLEKHKHRVHFCPDFALVVYFRNFIMQKRVPGQTTLPPLLSLVGARIEQAPFNYIPLVDIYENNFRAWTEEVLKEAFAADSFNVGTKELPIIKEQIRAAKDGLEAVFGSTLLKLQALDPGHKSGKDGDGRKILLRRFQCQLHAQARIRAALEALLDAYLDDPEANIKDLRAEYEFDGDNHDFKVIDELFGGKEMVDGFIRTWLHLPGASAGILKNEDKPRNEDRTAANLFRLYGADLIQTLQSCVNSIGISGVDVVQMGIQTKSTFDILALAEKTCADRQDAYDSMGEVFGSRAFKRLLEKGEYLDVSRSGLSNFFSGFDPPKDVLKHEIGKFRDVVRDSRKKVDEQREKVDGLQRLVKAEYEKWLGLLRKYEQAADELNLSVALSADDENYRPELLEFVTEMTPLDPMAAVE